MKNKIMPLHIQSMYIYAVKYGFTIEEIYLNIHNKAPITSDKVMWTKINALSEHTPMIAYSIEQAFHIILVRALLKPHIIDNVDLPMGKLKNDIVTFIAEHAQCIPLRQRLLKMRIGRMVDNLVGFIMKGIR